MRPESQRYKVVKDGKNWSLGYPTKSSAQAAARRLGVTAQWARARFTVAPMDDLDYKIMAEIEELDS